MIEKNPLVSIVTINFNNIKVTTDLLISIEECNYKNLQVIVVDNGSDDDPSDLLNKKFPDVEVIRSETNLGFSSGNNLGCKKSKGDYIFFVNNDTLFAENIIEELIEPFYSVSDLAIVSPKVIYYNSPNIIQYAGSTEISSYTGRNMVLGQGKVDNDELFKSGYTYFAHGAAMIVKKNVLDLIGGFPDVFFLYYEEMDYSYKIRKAGFKIFYNNKAVIYHRVSYSVGDDSPLKTYYMTRNRILFMQRNFSRFQFTVFLTFFIFFTTTKYSAKYLLKGRLDLLKSFYRGIYWNLKTSKDIKLSR